MKHGRQTNVKHHGYRGRRATPGKLRKIMVDEATIRLGLLLGLMKPLDDGGYGLTPQGSKWLRSFCRRALSDPAVREQNLSNVEQGLL